MQHNLLRQIEHLFHWLHLSVLPLNIVRCLDMFLKGWEPNPACLIFYWCVHSSANLCSITATYSFRATKQKHKGKTIWWKYEFVPLLRWLPFCKRLVFWGWRFLYWFVWSGGNGCGVLYVTDGAGKGFVMDASFSCRWLQNINTVICCW